jgi:hypothetical protein
MRCAISKMVTDGRAFVETAMSMHHSDFEVLAPTFGAACLVGVGVDVKLSTHVDISLPTICWPQIKTW